MFKQLLNGVQDKYRKMQEEEAHYQELLQKSSILPEFYSHPPVDNKSITVSHKLLMDLCPDLNESDAILIRGLIPIEELCLSCLYAAECKTGLKFYFVATTKYLWLINANGYLYIANIPYGTSKQIVDISQWQQLKYPSYEYST